MPDAPPTTSATGPFPSSLIALPFRSDPGPDRTRRGMTDSELSLLTEAAVARVHHAAIGTRDVEASLVFWRDGLGFEVLMDHAFDGPWPELFGGSASSLRSIFLGERQSPDAGIVELVDLAGMAPAEVAPPGPTAGFFLLSLSADIDAVLPRLAGLGVG